VEQLLARGDYVVGVDSLTYAARPDLLPNAGHFRFVEQDVRDMEHLHGADVLFHLAAESHVDNGNSDPRKFLDTNVGGTFHLLELVRGRRAHERPLFVQMSTDEVYGSVPEDYASQENEVLIPSSPYSASKAAADQLVMGWATTYGLRTRIVRGSN
jgi:dTDP-glucose 4,6-dehydratase